MSCLTGANILAPMTGYKPILFAVAVGVASPATYPAAPEARSLPEPLLPAISRLDQRFLTHCVRRMLEQKVCDGSIDAVRYVPPELRDLKCQILVTLREGGLHRGTGISQPAPILDACREAAELALERVATTGTVDADLLARLAVEIEAVGDPVPLDVSAAALLAGPVGRYVEPGVHGLRLTHNGISASVCPSEFAAFNTTLARSIRELAMTMTTSPGQLADVRVSRFRSMHWVQSAPDGGVVELRRGMIPVSLEAVSADALDAAGARVARYMLYRQRPSGRFAWAYDPSEDRYIDSDDEVFQADAARALCTYAGHMSEGGALSAAAQRAVDRLVRQVVDLSGIQGAGFVRTPDQKNRLGTTALTCLALSDHPRPGRHHLERDKLVGGMLWLQRPSGKFVTAFPPADILATQEAYPGQALLALARVYDDQPQQRIMGAFDRAFTYYRELFGSSPSPTFAGWHVQAYAKMAVHSKRDDFAEFAFTMADALVAGQLNRSNCSWPDKWGAIAPYHPAAVGAPTAGYLAGLCDALLLARRVGDDARMQAYEEAIRLGARFLMQIEFKPEEAYFVRSLQDTVGGVRASLIDSTLRIDYCGHTLVALTKAREVLYPDDR
ncbi:MAG: hypothetical protein JSV19_06475 [Phycisphaerales bacterium]|nr:MAG: hypothetical protein JSV19_06475 [Phycisphaerales bacterium]